MFHAVSASHIEAAVGGIMAYVFALLALLTVRCLCVVQKPKGVADAMIKARWTETAICESKDDRAAAREQASTEERLQEEKQAQSRAAGHSSDDTRQNAVDTVE
jgi:hypothetical protein